MKKEKIFNYVGIDLSKKTMEVVRIIPDGKNIQIKFKTNKLDSLLNWLKEDDIVALEAGNQSFRIAKSIINELGIEVIVLNPGDLAAIYASLKKTDKEDALKLARLIQRFPKEELPTVSIPSDEEEDGRRLSNEQSYWTKEKARLKNRLHSLFTQAGLTSVSKKDLSTKESRERVLPKLPTIYHNESNRLHKHLIEAEISLDSINTKIQNYLKSNKEKASILLSMTGIGLVTCLALLTCIGDVNRFSKVKQLSNYVGLVLRVDISGTIVRYGHIVRYCCKPIKHLITQCAWTLVRSSKGEVLRDFYINKKDVIGKCKAIVAVSRKMVEVIYRMLKTGETHRGVSVEELPTKLKSYGII